jgi:hypothetical protein
MPDASRRPDIPFAAILAFFVGVLAVTPPANALEGVRGGFGGVQGWGGLYRDNRDVGSFPVYFAYGGGDFVAWSYPPRHIHVHGLGYGQIHRHNLRRRRAVAYRCAPEPHCICH